MNHLTPDADTEFLKDIPRGKAEYFLFDFDGTISTIRHGWEAIMQPMMIEAAAECAHDGSAAEIENYIERSTGLQTIEQMTWLTGYVTGLGGKYREPMEYKEEYLRRLRENIAVRKEEAAAGTREKYIVPGAVAFLEACAATGRTLMLLSGTDEADVKAEAALLGVDHFFNGGIYGSINDVKRYSKRMVIDTLIEDHQIKGEALVISGDGPVEIECADAVGGVGIGVTCIEATRDGRDPAKDKRLRAAGASVIITDFTDKQYLIEWLTE